MDVPAEVLEHLARQVVREGYTSSPENVALVTEPGYEPQPGHAEFDPTTGICPTCGRLSGSSPQYDALGWPAVLHVATCHEFAHMVLTISYLDDIDHVDDEFPQYSRPATLNTYRATYGVVLYDGFKASCWAS